MQRLIRELWRSTGTTILFVTHNTHEALRPGARIIVLAGNRRSKLARDARPAGSGTVPPDRDAAPHPPPGERVRRRYSVGGAGALAMRFRLPSGGQRGHSDGGELDGSAVHVAPLPPPVRDSRPARIGPIDHPSWPAIEVAKANAHGFGRPRLPCPTQSTAA